VPWCIDCFEDIRYIYNVIIAILLLMWYYLCAVLKPNAHQIELVSFMNLVIGGVINKINTLPIFVLPSISLKSACYGLLSYSCYAIRITIRLYMLMLYRVNATGGHDNYITVVGMTTN
jgi:hypothetical protein